MTLDDEQTCEHSADQPHRRLSQVHEPRRSPQKHDPQGAQSGERTLDEAESVDARGKVEDDLDERDRACDEPGDAGTKRDAAARFHGDQKTAPGLYRLVE